MVTKDVWLDMVVDLRTAQACGTLGNGPIIKRNSPEFNSIHNACKQEVQAEYAGWISAPDRCEERSK